MANSCMNNGLEIGVCPYWVRFGDRVYAICPITWGEAAESGRRNAALAEWEPRS